MKDGAKRERQVKKLLEDEGWYVVKAGGSLGCADLVALKANHAPRLLQVKGDERSPWTHMGPEARLQLRVTARAAGADAEVVWWPSRKQPVWIPSSDWP